MWGVQQLGKSDEIYSRPANTSVATFIGSPTVNLLRGDTVGLAVEPANTHWFDASSENCLA